jgi:hypothetical protein
MSWSLVLGTPEADIHKYQVMSNGEFDPSMYECVVGQNPPPQVDHRPGHR